LDAGLNHESISKQYQASDICTPSHRTKCGTVENGNTPAIAGKEKDIANFEEAEYF
jgi:hypothetical protein